MIALTALLSLVTSCGLGAFLLPYQSANNDLSKTAPPLTIVIASNNKDESWKDDIVKATTIDRIQKIAGIHDCSVTLDDNIVYVIDEAAFGIKRINTELSAFVELEKSGIRCFQPLSEQDLSHQTYGYFLQHHINTPDFKDIYEKGSPRLFLSPSCKVKLSVKGKNIEVELPVKTTPETWRQLETPVPSPDSKAVRQLPKLDTSLFEYGQGLPSISVSFGGQKRSIHNRAVLTSRIMKIVSETIRKKEELLIDATNSLKSKLLKEQRDSAWGDGANSGLKSGKYDDLSEQTKRSLEANAAFNFKELGFNSEEEAVSFVRSSLIDSLQFDMNLCCYTVKNGVKVLNSCPIGLTNR